VEFSLRGGFSPHPFKVLLHRLNRRLEGRVGVLIREVEATLEHVTQSLTGFQTRRAGVVIKGLWDGKGLRGDVIYQDVRAGLVPFLGHRSFSILCLLLELAGK